MKTADLTQGKINKHILNITIPASVGMVFNTLFNVIDTFYAGSIGTTALAGMSLSFPVFFIMISIASGVGSGTTALAAIAIGAQDQKKYHGLAYNSLVMGLLLSVVLMIIGPLISKPLLLFMGASSESLQYGLDYLSWIFYGTFFFVLNMILNAILTSQGDTKSYRNVLIVAFILNIILDPMFVLGWFGLPKMGTMGVALATVIVQAIGTAYLIYKVAKSSYFDIHLFKKTRVMFDQWKELFKQGFPASVNMMTIALGVFVINYFVVKYAGDVGIAAYGAAVRVEQMALLPALGLNTAALTITGQNFGANKWARIEETYKRTLLYGLIIMVIGMIVIYPLARSAIGVFNSDPAVLDVGAEYLRIEVLCFTTYVLMGVSIAVLQGLKAPKIAIYVGIYRQFLMPMILLSLFGSWFGIKGIWYGIVLVNWTATIFTLIYTKQKMKKIHSTMTSIEI
jgi:putative MATE family efflux protein